MLYVAILSNYCRSFCQHIWRISSPRITYHRLIVKIHLLIHRNDCFLLQLILSTPAQKNYKKSDIFCSLNISNAIPWVFWILMDKQAMMISHSFIGNYPRNRSCLFLFLLCFLSLLMSCLICELWCTWWRLVPGQALLSFGKLTYYIWPTICMDPCGSATR